jgi:hypothetical protein
VGDLEIGHFLMLQVQGKEGKWSVEEGDQINAG